MNMKVKKGFTIFFAMLVGSLSLAIGLAIYDLTVRELDLSSTATQSQYAIYAADTGAECALYWDFKCEMLGECTSNGAANSAFATSSKSSPPSADVFCNSIDIAGGPPAAWTVDSTLTSAETTFSITFAPQPYCATVTVAKSGDPVKTVITSRGYNTCTSGAATRLERVLKVTY